MQTWMMIVVASSLLACTGDGDGDGDVQPDAPTQLRYPISVEVFGEEPLLVAYADADGPWFVIPTSPSNMYSFEATSRHAIVIVCGAAPAVRTSIVLRSHSDDPPPLYCLPQRGASVIPVTGQMMQPGEVHMGGTDAGTTSPWTFEFQTSAAVHDLFAFGESSVLVQRDIAVTTTTTLPLIDLANGMPYEQTAILLQNASADESIETVTTVQTDDSYASYRRSGTILSSLPQSMLTMLDYQHGEVQASTRTTLRTHRVEPGAPVSTIELMPALQDVQLTTVGASWGMLPASTKSVRLITADEDANLLTVEATGAFLRGDTSLSFDLDIPGYDDAWRVATTHGTQFTAVGELAETSIIADATESARRALVERSTRLRTDRGQRARSAAEAAARARRS
jgi:hypothetical protein